MIRPAGKFVVIMHDGLERLTRQYGVAGAMTLVVIVSRADHETGICPFGSGELSAMTGSPPATLRDNARKLVKGDELEPLSSTGPRGGWRVSESTWLELYGEPLSRPGEKPNRKLHEEVAKERRRLAAALGDEEPYRTGAVQLPEGAVRTDGSRRRPRSTWGFLR